MRFIEIESGVREVCRAGRMNDRGKGGRVVWGDIVGETGNEVALGGWGYGDGKLVGFAASGEVCFVRANA